MHHIAKIIFQCYNEYKQVPYLHFFNYTETLDFVDDINNFLGIYLKNSFPTHIPHWVLKRDNVCATHQKAEYLYCDITHFFPPPKRDVQ